AAVASGHRSNQVSPKVGQAKRRAAGSPLTGEALERLLSEGVFEAVWEREPDGEVTHWGGNFESIFGYPRREVVGRRKWWRERVHPDDLARVEHTSEQ